MLTLTKLLAIGLISTLLAVPAAATKPEAVKLYNEGEALMEQAKYTEALQKFIEAIDTDSVYSDARIKAAQIAEIMEDWANVKFQYLTVLTYEESNFDAILGAASYFVRVENFDEAQSYFDKASEIDPGSATLHFGLGSMYHKMKNARKARLEYKKTVALDDTAFPLAYYRLGRHEFDMAKQSKDYDKAEEYFTRYVELGKDGDILYSANMDLATIQIKTKSYGKALKHLSNAKLIKTSEWKPYFLTAEIYRAQRKSKDAENEYLATLEKKPGHGESHFRLALMYQEQYKDEDALKHYREASKDRSFKNRSQAGEAAAALEDYIRQVKEAEAG